MASDEASRLAEARKNASNGGKRNKARIERRRAAGLPLNGGSMMSAIEVYSDAESEYLRASDAYRVASGKKFMTATDYLSVLLSLGYSKGV